MKTWLKGGLIGLGIGILIILHSYTFGCNPIPLGSNTNSCTGSIETIIAFLEVILMLPAMIFISWFQFIETNIILSFIISSIYFFLLGALIGLIVKKIKKINKH
jgi:hypothetical protein